MFQKTAMNENPKRSGVGESLDLSRIERKRRLSHLRGLLQVKNRSGDRLFGDLSKGWRSWIYSKMVGT